MNRLCSLPDCGRVHFCKGYCRLHFERWNRHGSPLTVLKPLSKRGAPRQWLKDHADFQGDACLIWPFALHADGYAHIAGGRPTRIMCELAHGPAPTDEHEAAHSCGRGHEACVSPVHLRWATPVENAADKFAHGTVSTGERHYAAKLTDAAVREIRQLRGSMLQRDIAARFGVGVPCISGIVNGKSRRSA